MVNPDLSTALFSAREAAKQLVLLEDHLASDGKRCPDCVRKHALAAEAFAEEALSLEGGGALPWLAAIPGAIRAARTREDIRAVRKELVERLGGEGPVTGLAGLGALERVSPPRLLSWLFWGAMGLVALAVVGEVARADES